MVERALVLVVVLFVWMRVCARVSGWVGLCFGVRMCVCV